jgi:thiol:disulfide interchange protein DsbA
MYTRLFGWLSTYVALSGLLLSAQPASAQAQLDPAALELGEHYERLVPTQPTSSSPDRVEVAEIFWYGCPHCFAFDPYLEDWKTTKPEHVNFIRIPAVWNAGLRLHARAFYTAQVLGKSEEMHEAFFREIHENRNPLDTEAALTDFFGRFGVAGEEFKAAFDSFEVHSMLEKADEFNRRYQISSVPTVVINGKYKTTAVMTGSYENLMVAIDALAASEYTGD